MDGMETRMLLRHSWRDGESKVELARRHHRTKPLPLRRLGFLAPQMPGRLQKIIDIR